MPTQHRLSQVMPMEHSNDRVAELFPTPYRAAVAALLDQRGERVEELRLRAGVPVSWVTRGRELWLDEALPPAEPALLEELIRRASGHAVYAVEEQLRRGYLTLPGGCRLGLSGTVSVTAGSVKTIREIQALNLRFARERPGCADAASSFLWSNPGSMLILGPPGAGKTTVLRDLVRQLSDRFSRRVGLVDERGELAACRDGLPQLNVGRRTDVLTACPKAAGIELLLRAMSPEWIAVDEITAARDAEALAEAACCGVRFLATVHASDCEELRRRPSTRKLLAAGIFENLAVIDENRKLRCERIRYGTVKAGRDRDGPGLYLLRRSARSASAAQDA